MCVLNYLHIYKYYSCPKYQVKVYINTNNGLTQNTNR